MGIPKTREAIYLALLGIAAVTEPLFIKPSDYCKGKS